MNSLRKILFPFSILYGLITSIRNKAFDFGVLKSKSYDIPLIVVGNLSVGGTGKSPMIEYLIRLLPQSLKITVLSRGYGRETKGFRLANDKSTAKEIGDEPFQFYRKFKNIRIAVDEKRVNGLDTLFNLKPETDLVLLDDAFQHRYVKAGCTILLTAYDNLYTNDIILPAGNLREGRSGAERAQIIIVSKCPENLRKEERKSIKKQINPNSNQVVFFSRIKYDNRIFNNEGGLFLKQFEHHKVILVTGIANSLPMENYLKKNHIIFEHLKFKDHERIVKEEIEKIKGKLKKLPGDQKIIITTEKDFVRSFIGIDLPIYYLPIETEIIDDSETFNELIQEYVRKNKRDSKVS